VLVYKGDIIAGQLQKTAEPEPRRPMRDRRDRPDRGERGERRTPPPAGPAAEPTGPVVQAAPSELAQPARSTAPILRR